MPKIKNIIDEIIYFFYRIDIGDIVAWVLIILLLPLLILFLIYLLISDHIKWNHGICKKCKSNQLDVIVPALDGDLFTKFKCESCNHTTKIFSHDKGLTSEEAVTEIRNQKLKSLL